MSFISISFLIFQKDINILENEIRNVQNKKRVEFQIGEMAILYEKYSIVR